MPIVLMSGQKEALRLRFMGMKYMGSSKETTYMWGNTGDQNSSFGRWYIP